MRFQNAVSGEAFSVWFALPKGETVTVTAKDQTGGVLSIADSSTVEDYDGVYRWNSSQFTSQPGGYTNIVFRATAGTSGARDIVVIAVGGHLNDIDTPITTRSSHSASDVTTDMDTNSVDLNQILSDIAALNDLAIADIQTALTNQGYTAARAILLDNLDAAITSLNDLSITDVQTAMTNQGYSVARAALIDNLDDTISSVRADIAALNDIDQGNVQAAMTAQGYTVARAALLDNLDAAISTVFTAIEKVRKVTTNKVTVNSTDTTVTVFEDNGTTVAFTFTISADRRTRTPD